MGNNGFDGLEIRIGGRLAIRQNIGSIEDVEPLVLHRTEVEIPHGDDVEDVQVILPAEHVLVPSHGPFQGVHGIGRACAIALVHEDVQGDIAARHGLEPV